MKKRILLVIIAAIMTVVSACAPPAPDSGAPLPEGGVKSQDAAAEPPVPVPDTPAETEMPEEQLPGENMAINEGVFLRTSKDVFDAYRGVKTERSFEKEPPLTRDYDGFSADWIYSYAMRSVCYRMPGSENVAAVSLVATGKDMLNESVRKSMVDYYNGLLDLFLVNNKLINIEDGSELKVFSLGKAGQYEIDGVRVDYKWDDKFFALMVYPQTTKLDIASLPVQIEPPKDYMSSKERFDAFDDMVYKGDIDKILALAKEYIEKEQPEPTDSAYAIRDTAQATMDLIAKCNVVRDKVEETYRIYYRDVEKVSREINILPYIEDGIMFIEFGFKASDWVFFDKTIINCNDDDELIADYYSYNDVKRDVVSGGVVEQAETFLLDYQIERIAKGDSPVLRFSGDDGKKRDHVITRNEASALQTIQAIELKITELKGIKRGWTEIHSSAVEVADQ